MNNLFEMLASDPNVAPAFRRLFATPPADARTVAFEKASPRRFSGESLTGFGGIDEIGSDRRRDVMDEELACQRDDERRERMERGE